MTPIAVVGGMYAEDCAYPRSEILRGSGLRAASVLTGLGSPANLHTVTGPALADDFHAIAVRKGIELHASAGPEDIWFRYRHPLAKPDIYPPIITPVADRPIVHAETALIFGMLEGRPQVTANRAVYDPQDGFRAQPFEVNGSVATELAIVASWSEGRALTGKTDPAEIAESLLNTGQCVAAVIKCGPQGALVATNASSSWIQAFPSRRVWKIGSGDVFSAAFAHAWLSENQPAVEAAWFASRMVSEYVATREETFSHECMQTIRQEAVASVVKSRSQPRDIPKTQIYLAGPFFTTGQQWLVDEARYALRDMGFEVFSPIHEVGEGPPEAVAPADLFALENSGLVFALLDGLDAGTVFEVGYARARGIPVVGVAESTEAKSLTMLLGSACTIADDFATGVYTACWQLMGDV